MYLLPCNMATRTFLLILLSICFTHILCHSVVDKDILSRMEELENIIRKQSIVINEQSQLIKDLQKVNEGQDRRIDELAKRTATAANDYIAKDEAGSPVSETPDDAKVNGEDGVASTTSGRTQHRDMAASNDHENNPGKRIVTSRTSNVAFTAYYDHPFGTGNVRDGETIVFNKVLYNEGNDYNINSGIFACSQSGVYLFSVSVSTYNENAVAKIVIDGHNQLATIAEGEQTMHDVDVQGSTTLITHVSEGQHVWVVQYYENDVVIRGQDQYRFTSFSGVLLY